jgi:transcriptional regulator with XRE-family HTH domain
VSWGRRIHHLRQKACLTQEQLAQRVVDIADADIQLHRSAIAHWEAGRAEPALRYRRALARALDIDFDLLFAPPEGLAA